VTIVGTGPALGRPLSSEPVETVGVARWWTPRRTDLGVAALFLLGALWVTGRGWRHVYQGLLGTQPQDQVFNEWMLAHDAHAVAHLENPFFTTLQNAPDGVNLMGNVAMQLAGILLAPVTLLGGAPLSYLLLITLNLAATAFGWYYVLARHVVQSRLAALLGGALCGFAPGLIAHSNGHPHITAQFLVPFIVWRVARLTEPGRAVRNGLALGGLVVAQFFIGEEILLLTAVGCAVAAIACALSRPREAKRAAPAFLTGLGVAAGLVLCVVAYPMLVQFFGPQHYHGAPDSYPADLASYLAFGREAIAGSASGAQGLAPNSAEETAFFGRPLLILALAVTVWLWRNLVARIASVTAVVAAGLSLGPDIVSNGRDTGAPGPYALLDGLPVLDAIIVGRFALVAAAALGILLAVATDRVLTLPPTGRAVAAAAIVAALVPIAPTPLQVADRPDVPRFISSGQWREYVEPGRTLVPVPVEGRTGLRWATVADLGFAVPQGYFLGPTGPDDDSGRWSAPLRPTWQLLGRVAAGRDVAVTERERAQAQQDVRFWRADAVVLYDRAPRAEALRRTLDALFDPGRQVSDVHVYPVRA
jgi:hypothetical protein